MLCALLFACYLNAGLMPDNKNAVIWIGTESGHAPYPVWSTQTGCASGAGSAIGESYVPKEVDLTLQNSDTSVRTHPLGRIIARGSNMESANNLYQPRAS